MRVCFALLSLQLVTSFVCNIRSTCVHERVLRNTAVGIDLGTTNSLVSVVKSGQPAVLSVNGSNVVPSTVRYLPDGNCVVGVAAQVQQLTDPQNTFSSAKRVIGKTVREVQESGDTYLLKKAPPVIGASHTPFEFNCPALQSKLAPEAVSAKVLSSLIEYASVCLGGTNISKAVITVPAYFSAPQCDATVRAGKLAGLSKIKLLREPEAAAIAYGLNLCKPQTVLVFDLGGGTFDVSVLDVGDGLVEVIATSGDNHLGGDDFDNVIIDWIIGEISRLVSNEAATRARNDAFIAAQLRSIAVNTKSILSEKRETTIVLESILQGENITLSLKRSRLEALSKRLFSRLLKPLREVALMAGINLPGESGHGGRTVKSQKQLTNRGLVTTVNDQDNKLDQSRDASFNANALREAQLTGKRVSRQFRKTQSRRIQEFRKIQRHAGSNIVTSFPVGKSVDEVLLVGGATRMPAVIRLVRTLTGVTPVYSINPDEVVCLGAGIQAGILNGDISHVRVMSAWQAAIVRMLQEEQQAGGKSVLDQLRKVDDEQ